MLVTAAVSGLILLAAFQLCFIKFASANPYGAYAGEGVEVHPLSYPSISILYPTANNTLCNSNNLTITFTATIESGSVSVQKGGAINPTVESVEFQAFIEEIYYKPSWQPDSSRVMSFDYSDPWHPKYIINLTGIPDGNQTVKISAYGHGNYPITVPLTQEYPWDPATETVCYFFDSVSNYTLGLTVDTRPPQVSVLGLDNNTFSASEVPLNFALNETAAEIKYCLDGQENVTITGNTTLTGLATGDHSLTVYAVDEAGNAGSSETINFYVTPFPTTLVIASVTVAVIGIGLLVYFKKRKH